MPAPRSAQVAPLARPSASSDILCTDGGSRDNRHTPAPPIQMAIPSGIRVASSSRSPRMDPRG
jgi:hypothetical protein